MDLRTAIAHQTGFSLQLVKHVGTALGSDRNLVFSPLSLHVIVALISAGAKGPTRDQILSLLAAQSPNELATLASQTVIVVLADGSAGGGPRVVFSNGIWVNASLSLKPSFKEIVNGVYKAEAKAVDFQTNPDKVAQEVNSWVENITSGLIKELLPSGSVTSNTRLVLGNVLYFKGAWDKKFDATKTTGSDFHLLNGSSIQVPFMISKEKQFISSHESFKVLKLPYKNGGDGRQFSLYIFLPDAPDGLWSLTVMLSDVKSIDRYLPVQKVSVRKFKIPKFKVSFGFEASEVLKGLGLVLPFSRDGDLTEMVDSPVNSTVYVSSIFHKSFVEVNEEGTEAAAASAAVVSSKSLPRDLQDFEADHPFMFLIREDMTGVVMFVGHVLNPLLAE